MTRSTLRAAPAPAVAAGAKASPPETLIVCAGVVLASLDLFIVNVALPQMARDLHAPDLGGCRGFSTATPSSMPRFSCSSGAWPTVTGATVPSWSGWRSSPPLRRPSGGELALGVPCQRPGRRRRPGGGLAPPARGARTPWRTARPGGRGTGHRRSGASDLRSGQRSRLGLDFSPDRLHPGRSRRRAGGLRLALPDGAKTPRHRQLFRSRQFTGASIIAISFSAAFGATLLSIVLWEQGAWGWSALPAGLGPGPLMVPVMSFLVAGRLIRRYGPALVISLGAAAFIVAVAWWALAVTASPDYAAGLLGGMILSGVGVGLTLPTLMSATTASLPAHAFATGSAVINMIRQTGLALGVAVLVALLGTGAAPPQSGARLLRARVVADRRPLRRDRPRLGLAPPAPARRAPAPHSSLRGKGSARDAALIVALTPQALKEPV